MTKIISYLLTIVIALVINASFVLACTSNAECPTGASCAFDSTIGSKVCQATGANTVFGTIVAPPSLQSLMGGDPSGTQGISKFLSNLISLIYMLAMIVFLFMIIWGAYDWLTSEGDKEKIENARRKIINAIVGIMLFAVAFAVIRVIGQFTGFKFFVGQ